MINLQSAKTGKHISLITDIKEVTPAVLKELTKNFKLPPGRCIVALCQKVKIFDIAASITNKKEQIVSVYPLIANGNSDDLKRANTAIGDIITVNRTAIELGSHLIINTMASVKNTTGFFHADKELCAKIVKGDVPQLKKKGTAGTTGDIQDRIQDIYLLEFKVINVVDIVASMPVGAKHEDPFAPKVAANATTIAPSY